MSYESEVNILLKANADGVVRAGKQAADALDQVAKAGTTEGKALGEVAKTTEKATANLGDLKQILSQLSREFPLLGRAAQAFMNPVALAATVAAAAFGYARQALQKWNEEMDQAAGRAASKDFEGGMRAKSSAMHDAATSASQFRQALQDASTAQETLRKGTDAAVGALREYINTQAEIYSAAEARDLAVIEAGQRAGALNEVQALTARASIRDRYQKARQDLKTRAEDEEIRILAEELETAKSQQADLERRANEANKRKGEVVARIDQAKADLAAGQAKLQEYEEAAQKALDAQGKAESGVETAHRVGHPLAVPSAMARLASAREAAAAAVRQRDAQRALNERNRGIIATGASELLPAAESDWSEARSGALGNASRIAELQAGLPALQATFGARQQGRAVIGELQSQTSSASMQGSLSEALGRGMEDQRRMQASMHSAITSGAAITREMLQALQALILQNQQASEEIKRLRTNSANLR